MGRTSFQDVLMGVVFSGGPGSGRFRPMHHPNREAADTSRDPSFWDRAGTHRGWPHDRQGDGQHGQDQGRFPSGRPKCLGR